MGIAHVTFELGTWCERRHRVDDDYVHSPGADQHVGDLERLLARVGLGDQQFVDVDTDGFCVDGVERVLRIDVGADSPITLCFRNYVQREGRLARGLRSEHLNYPPSREPTDPESEVKGHRASRDHFDPHSGVLTHAHD